MCRQPAQAVLKRFDDRAAHFEVHRPAARRTAKLSGFDDRR